MNVNVNRRDFLKIGMLTATAATFTACGRPVEHGVVSQYQMPEYALPGQALFWASVCTELRSDCAVSVKTVENRAVNVIGMPGHFFSKGFASKEAISGLQVVYNPARIKDAVGAVANADGSTESLALTVAKEALSNKGSLLFVVDRVSGTSGHALVEAAKALDAKIWIADSEQSLRERRIVKAVTGKAELPYYPLEQHDFVLSVGSNFLAENYCHSRVDWSFGHFRRTPGRLRGRMVSVSARMNPTDVCSDQWIAVPPGFEANFLAAVGTAVAEKKNVKWPAWATVDAKTAADKVGLKEEAIHNLADRLIAAEAPLVVGGFQGADGDATVFLAHTLTQLLGMKVPTFEPDMLVGSGKVSADIFLNDSEAATFLKTAKMVVLHGVDLVYRYPWLAESYKAVASKAVLATMPNESTDAAYGVKFLVPLRFWMEDWGDLLVHSPEGVWYGLMQPAIRSQVAGAVSALGFYLELAKTAGAGGIEEVNPRKALQAKMAEADWENLLVRGGYWEQEPEAIYRSRAAYPPEALAYTGAPAVGYAPFESLEPLRVSGFNATKEGTVLISLPTHLGDGAITDRYWMQELPDAITTVSWDSWIEINEDWAKSQKIARHDLVSVKVGDRVVKGSAYPSPFIHPGAVGIPSGRGHKRKVLQQFADLGWDGEANSPSPKGLLDGSVGPSGYFETTIAGASVVKDKGSRIMATFDKRVYDLPRYILPE